MAHIILNVFGFNTTARALYDKLGYTVAATIMMMRIGEDDWRLRESAAALSHRAIRRRQRAHIGYNTGVCAAHDTSIRPGEQT